MRSLAILTALLVSAAIAAPAMQQKEQTPQAAPAQAEAESWLKIVDSGRYGDSWDRASEVFKKALTKDQWDDSLKKIFASLGAFESRSVALTQFLKDPPNSPPGDYFLIQFEANYKNRHGATETVVVTHQEKKEWRVAGFFIK